MMYFLSIENLFDFTNRSFLISFQLFLPEKKHSSTFKKNQLICNLFNHVIRVEFSVQQLEKQ